MHSHYKPPKREEENKTKHIPNKIKILQNLHINLRAAKRKNNKKNKRNTQRKTTISKAAFEIKLKHK